MEVSVVSRRQMNPQMQAREREKQPLLAARVPRGRQTVTTTMNIRKERVRNKATSWVYNTFFLGVLKRVCVTQLCHARGVLNHREPEKTKENKMFSHPRIHDDGKAVGRTGLCKLLRPTQKTECVNGRRTQICIRSQSQKGIKMDREKKNCIFAVLV